MFSFSVGIDTVREVVRDGTMWFIRDPQSADFHPVREILERDSSAQFRKIAISGLLYAGVIFATVGVNVLFLRYAVSDVLPLRWVYGFVGFSTCEQRVANLLRDPDDPSLPSLSTFSSSDSSSLPRST